MKRTKECSAEYIYKYFDDYKRRKYEKEENSGESDGNIDSNNRESNINSDNDESGEKIDSKAMENSTDEKEDKPKFVSLDNF